MDQDFGTVRYRKRRPVEAGLGKQWMALVVEMFLPGVVFQFLYMAAFFLATYGMDPSPGVVGYLYGTDSLSAGRNIIIGIVSWGFILGYYVGVPYFTKGATPGIHWSGLRFVRRSGASLSPLFSMFRGFFFPIIYSLAMWSLLLSSILSKNYPFDVVFGCRLVER